VKIEKQADNISNILNGRQEESSGGASQKTSPEIIIRSSSLNNVEAKEGDYVSLMNEYGTHEHRMDVKVFEAHISYLIKEKSKRTSLVGDSKQTK
jgi:hypothetical protein